MATLKATVAALEEQVETATTREIPLLKGTVQAVIDVDIDDIGEFLESGRAFRENVATPEEQLDAAGERLAALGDIGAAKATKKQKLAAILSFAQNKRDAGQSTVAMTATDIRGCVGLTVCYHLLDELVESA